MGEYATYNGESVKIGTCENMYYLRADQANKVRAESGNVDPMNPKDRETIRFRFPWPDEDTIEPGSFEQYGRGVTVHGFTPSSPFEHYSVQFTASAGYCMSIPCPEGMPGAAAGLTAGAFGGATIHRNGFVGAVHLVQQAERGGLLVSIIRCGPCGALSRVPVEDAPALAVAIRAEGDRRAKDGVGDFLHAVADRVLAGYGLDAPMGVL